MNEIIDILKEQDNFVVLTHVNPDGDAIGSSLGMYHILKKLGKSVDIVINEAPVKFSYLEGFYDIKISSDKFYNYAVIVDTATKDRVNTGDILENVDKTIVIDHHISNTKFGDYNYVEDLPACSQIIYDVFKQVNISIDKNIGEALANGIITDTGGLSHGDVISRTYETIFELSNTIDIPYIFKNTISKVTKSEFELRKITINNLKFYKDNKIAVSFVTDDDIKKVNGTHYDAASLVNIGREIDGVYVSIFSKIFDNGIRISLRSNNVDVNLIANAFGGGGHVYASGITLNNNEDYEKIVGKIIKETERRIDEWDNNSK